MERNLVCNECGGVMMRGFIPDLSYGGALMTAWVEGKPKKSFWSGISFDFYKRKNYCVTAYCCERCGYIKIYAETDLPAFK